MCVGIPMQVIEVEAGRARCVGRSGEAWLDTALVGEVRLGDWLLAFLGGAREVLDAERAAQISAALEALDALQSGAPVDIDAFFPDLVGREPQLPDFLRPENLTRENT